MLAECLKYKVEKDPKQLENSLVKGDYSVKHKDRIDKNTNIKAQQDIREGEKNKKHLHKRVTGLP